MNWFNFSKNKNTPKRRLLCVRMEAIGGQGANSAGKVLAEAAVIGHGYSGSHFASFGSEKRGSPVQSFVKISPTEDAVRSAFFETSPDLIVIFHEAMLGLHPSCLAGADGNTDIIINTSKSPSEIEFPKGFKARAVICIDAGRISRHEKCGVNAALLGACLAALPEIDEDVLAKSLDTFFHRLSQQSRNRNISGLKRGHSDIKRKNFSPDQSTAAEEHAVLPKMGWANAPIGGIISNPGNSVLKDNSLSRNGTAPKFISELCFNCGYCDMVCPDYCFVWENENGTAKLKGIDYQYCKGCQKCIEVCPVKALQLSPEAEIPNEERLTKFKNIDVHSIEAKWNNKWQNVDWIQNYPDDDEKKE